MRERMCVWQDTMLELGFNIQVSRCVNKESDFYFAMIHKERCEACSHREAIEGEDAIANSLLNDVYTKLVIRHDEVIEHLLSSHCKKCEHFDKGEGICGKTRRECPFPVRDLMQNPDNHCELGLW